MSRRRFRVERGKFLGEGIQANECRPVVILIMAFDQTRREAVEGPRAAEKRSYLISHGRLSKIRPKSTFAKRRRPACGQMQSLGECLGEAGRLRASPTRFASACQFTNSP